MGNIELSAYTAILSIETNIKTLKHPDPFNKCTLEHVSQFIFIFIIDFNNNIFMEL